LVPPATYTLSLHDALPIYDGDPAKPHALLTSGLHSDGFVNCTYITQRPSMLNRILHAEDGLAAKLPRERVDWVIGSAMGAVTFRSEEHTSELQSRENLVCR